MFIVSMYLLFLSCPALAGEWHPKQSPNKVSWTAVGSPGFLRINGEGGKVQGMLADKSGNIAGSLWVALDAYKTGSETRDEHMHEKYLETKKFPKAKLELNPVSFAGGKRSFTGKLTIKGETKPVKGWISFQQGQNAVHIKAGFDVAISDYPAIGVPSWLGITVADKVEVSVDFVAEGK
jgi:polyisoprenoid-binding protein YceI